MRTAAMAFLPVSIQFLTFQLFSIASLYTLLASPVANPGGGGPGGLAPPP